MEKSMDRREFLKQGSAVGLAAAGVPLSRAAADGPAAPSPEHARQLAGRQLDSGEFCLSMYERATPALSFAAPDERAARRWQHRARARVVELLGGFPARRAELRPEVLERVEIDGYVREKVVFQTRDNLSAIGYLLLPRERTGPLPVVVCLPGHGRGADDIVGIDEQGRQRVGKTGYAKDFAIQAVEQGYAAFALELLGFGHRRDAAARRKGAGESSCRPAAGAALLFGQTMAGWRVWDVMRTIDYLATRPEIDAGRIATMGISGGGTVSLFAAALDPRVKVGVVSCYFNTFRDSIVSISHCMDNYVPGLLNQLEMYDLAGLIAPRFLFVEAGARDRIFPLAGSRTAIAEAERIYGVFGVPERMGHEVFDGGHEFHGSGAFHFLRKWL